MNELGLRKEILDYQELFKAFEGLLKIRHKFLVSNDRLATTLCELYAIMGAYQILACVRSTGHFDVNAIPEGSGGACEWLPKHETVQNAGRDLVAAVASGDQNAASDALIKMGVLALCPPSKCIFAAMDVVTQRVTGRAQQVFLVDVSRFAAKTGDYKRASDYLQRARRFDLSSWELYNACLIQGLIAVNAGEVDEAIECLARSIRACLAYERARVECCIRAPSFELAEALLDRGEREAVLRHLLDCKSIWDVLQPQIDNWIHIIEEGGKPDFQATGNLRIPEKPSHRLRMQWMNACCLAERPVSAEQKAIPVKSPAERKAEHARWMAENQHVVNAVVRKTIAYLDKDLVTPTDRPSTDPADSDQEK